MAPFKFRLEQVRVYRKQLEEQAMQALAQAVMRRDAVALRVETLQASIIEQRTRLCQADTLDAAERWLIQSYATALKVDLLHAHRELTFCEEEVDRCRVALIEKAKDRGLLDSLKEKQALRHLQLERQQEQRTNDETATLRYRPSAI